MESAGDPYGLSSGPNRPAERQRYVNWGGALAQSVCACWKCRVSKKAPAWWSGLLVSLAPRRTGCSLPAACAVTACTTVARASAAFNRVKKRLLT